MTILVTGATGTVGRHVVQALIEAGAPVRALTRDPAKADLPDGVEVVAGDLTDPSGLAPAFAGVTAVHLINFAGDAYAALTTGPEIVELAVTSGVRRVTILGGREDGELEKLLDASELEVTRLNPVEFMRNTRQWWAASVAAGDEVRWPFGHQLSALVHEADIGAVAATVLMEGGHGGQTYTITGPEAITVTRKVELLSEAIGRDIRFVELTADQARAMWKSHGMPDEIAAFLIEALGNTPEEGYTVVPTVERITGRPARTFAQWAAENAAAFSAAG
ncbi:NmrA family NAD(P)-binding protein [Spirillospora sp. CA-294931]|uniref:NmrA family NAD(P)-binding protein n=1 Tax=Spirillospora sp. CA-294931 TaxID=3240042 RepID=UPI003D92C5E7